MFVKPWKQWFEDSHLRRLTIPTIPPLSTPMRIERNYTIQYSIERNRLIAIMERVKERETPRQPH